MSIKKKVAKELRQTAAKLPVIADANFKGVAVKNLVSGEQLIRAGKTGIGPYGKTRVELKKFYGFDSPLPVIVNHYCRLKKALQRHGVDGIAAYIKKAAA